MDTVIYAQMYVDILLVKYYDGHVGNEWVGSLSWSGMNVQA